MDCAEIVVLIIMVVLVVFYIQSQNFEVEYVVSDVDGKRYLVKNVSDKKEAANMIARLNKKLSKLISELVKKYPDDADIQRLQSNFNPENVSEGSEKSNYTSYSVNKGEQIVFCLRSRDGAEKLVPPNVLMYVAIHELSHLMTKEIGHPPKFWSNFKRILQFAVDIKIYNKVDYAATPAKYCGLTIKSSVL
jgi:predicted metal-dependent hydrolase